MADSQETFISHLVELRTRLIRAFAAILIVFVCLFPWAKELYALMAQPLLSALSATNSPRHINTTCHFFICFSSIESAHLLPQPAARVTGTA